MDSSLNYLKVLQEYYQFTGGKSLVGKKISLNYDNINNNILEDTQLLNKLKLAGYADEFIKEQVEKIDEIYSSGKFTKYERKTVAALLWKYIRFIEENIIKENSKNHQIVWGSIPNGNINAEVIRTPSQGLVIVFNDGIFPFFNQICKIISQAIPKDDDKKFLFEEVKITFPLKGNLDESFVDLMVSYVIDGSAYLSEQKFIDKNTHSIAAMFFQSAEMFIVAHEYSHILSSHFDDSQVYDTSSRVEDIVSRNWKTELEADVLALQITILYCRSVSIPDSFALAGIDVLLNSMNIIYQLVNIENYESHPPPSVRQKTIREWYGKIYNIENPVFSVSNVVEKILQSLWFNNKTLLEERIINAQNNAPPSTGPDFY